MKLYIGKKRTDIAGMVFYTAKCTVYFFPRKKEEIFWGVCTIERPGLTNCRFMISD